jgi:hypothetical protein
MAKAAPSVIRRASSLVLNNGTCEVLPLGVENQWRPEDLAFFTLVFLFAALIGSLSLIGSTVPAPSVAPRCVTSPPHTQNRDAASERQEFYSIPELAIRWRCSRGTVYNRLRFAGAKVLDFASAGKKGKKLVPALTVFHIESRFMKGLP